MDRANRSTEHRIEITKLQEQVKNMEAELELSGKLSYKWFISLASEIYSEICREAFKRAGNVVSFW